MRTILLVAALAASLAHAQEYRSTAAITLEGTDPFQRIQLPFEAYRDTRRDMGDIRVLNGKGEAVPMAYAGEAVAMREQPQIVRLAQFPVSAAPAPGAASDRVDVHVRTMPDGTLVSVEQRAGGKAPPPPNTTAYLLDASQVKFAIASLHFDWEAKPGSEVVKVGVEASDDLRAWRPVAARTPLVRLEQGGHVLAQSQVPLNGVSAKYLRITWDAANFNLRSVDAESLPTTRPPEPRRVTTAFGQRNSEGDFAYDLGARLPVEAIRVVFPEVNSVAPFQIAAKDTPEGPWYHVAAGTFYRIVREGTELVSQPVEIGIRPSREWRLRPLVKSDGPPPKLEVSWRPAEVIFVAKGDGPFSLAFGNAEARGTAIPIASLMPSYERGAERRLPAAKLAEVHSAPPPTGAEAFISSISPRKALLWAVLIIAVVVLGSMAWRLRGQMNR